MSSVRSLANLLCARCGDVTLHSANVCQREGCGQVNRDSGNPPAPRTAVGFNTLKAAKYNAAQEERGRARRAARHARRSVLARGP